MKKPKDTKYDFRSAMVEEHAKASRALMKRLRNDKAKAREFLVSTGIYDNNGNLTEPYK